MNPWEEYQNNEQKGPWTDFQKQDVPVFAERPKDQKVDPDTLQHDQDWLTASRIMYEKSEGKAWEGSAKDLAEYGLDQMGWFNYNLPRMALDANRLRNADDAEKASFLYLMDTYDKLEMSWGGAGRFIKGAAADPLTWVGLSTFGFGMVGKESAKLASKEGLKQLLRAGTVAGIEGAAFGAADSAIRQSVEVSGGRRENIDMGDVAIGAGIGAGAGFVLGGAVEGARNVITSRIGKKGAQEVAPSPSSVIPDPNAANAAPNAAGAVPNEAAATPSPNLTSAESTVATRVVPDPTINAAAATPSPNPASVMPNVADAVPAPESRTLVDLVSDLNKFLPKMDQEGVVIKMTRDEVVNAAQQISTTLKNLGIDATSVTPENLRAFGLTADQQTILTRGAKEAFEQLGKLRSDLVKQERAAADDTVREALQKQIDDLKDVQNAVGRLDVERSSTTGSDLSSRVGGLFVNEDRGLTPEKILRDQGIDPAKATREEIRAAEDQFAKRIDEIEAAVRNRQELIDIEQRIRAAQDAGDTAQAVKLSAERHSLIGALENAEAAKRGFASNSYQAINDRLIKPVTEYVISTVFSTATVVVNTLPAIAKTLYKPLLNYVVKGPFDQAALREMTATYSVLLTHQSAALSAARAAFKYERGLLTNDMSQFLAQQPSISGLKGRVLRTFPRILNATDEYFMQLNYRGYVVGQATADAYAKGAREGLTGKKLDDFVKDRVEKALKDAYEVKPDMVNVIDMLRMQGIDRGYSGANLDQWVKAELARNQDLFRQAQNQAGRDYAEDMLFKRAFSGDGTASKLAKGYEGFVNRNPIMRLAGQLFFRTPVRVFEEGIRMTPGLNMISPNFVSDLKGTNGPQRQIRAQGEAMMGYAIGAGVLALYSSGAITGGGPSDYKQRRTLENGKEFEPYSIRFKDGTTFNFRNLDPLATPMKIMVNALDRFQMLQYRKAQGEYVDNLEKEVFAWLGVSVGAVSQAVRDANLTEGIDQILSLVEVIGNPEENQTQAWKLLGQKLQLAVPSMVQKVQLQENPFLNDPKTMEQFLRARINPGDPLVPKQYDAMGNVRTVTNPLASLTGINITSPALRAKSVDEKIARVNQELALIEIATDSSFIAPYKRQELGDLDLRKVMTADGKVSLYDRWQEKVRNLGLTDILYDQLVGNEALTLGTASNDGIRIKVARETINKIREAAFYELLSEEADVEKRFMDRLFKKSDALTGARDVRSIPFQ